MPGSDCPGCGSASFRTLFRAWDRVYRISTKTFLVVECAECGLMRVHPRPDAAELRSLYPDNYWFAPESTAAGRLEEAYRRFVLRDHIGFVRRALAAAGESGPVVDYGCGGGLLLRMLAERGAQVLGLDLSPRAAAVAWRRNGVPCACASLTAAPLPPNSCAAVTMFHVLEHLENPQEYLAVAHELLRPGGRLIVQVPNAASWQFLLLGENWNGIDPRHLLNFRASDLEALLDFCGFEVLRRKYFSLRDNPAGFATSLAPSLNPMTRRVSGGRERFRVTKDLLYLALVAASVPFTLLEAWCRCGSTIMLEARKKTK